jgi:hypothetical protein
VAVMMIALVHAEILTTLAAHIGGENTIVVKMPANSVSSDWTIRFAF